ncbi:MAG TPA: hypothetical protein VGB24_23235 [Longimicrobium sp.]|jgi:hypothetical protein|uniref:hypothetical protein n=1 Tax=Longimicrobium sp. TaxID=2029185 RepID=UPI002ED9182F
MTLSIFRLARPLFALAVALAAAAALPDRAAAQGTDTVAVAQDTLFEVRLTDGSVLYGRIVENTTDRVVLRTQSGAMLTVERAQIASMQPIRGRVIQGRVWREDPNATRLFFGPTGRAVGAGRGYLGVYEVVLPFVTYGVTNQFSISAGTPIIPGAMGEIFYIAPKFTLVETDQMAVAAGVLAGSTGDETAGVVYGVGTFGDRDQAASLGVGFGFSNGDLDGQPVVMAGGELRVGGHTKLITENYFAPGESGVIGSGGVRFFGERLSADFGIFTNFGAECEGLCFLPLVNFVYSF